MLLSRLEVPVSEGAMATEGSGGAREQEQEHEEDEDEDEWQDEVEEQAEANRSRGGEEGGAAEDGEAIVEVGSYIYIALHKYSISR